MQTKYQIGRTRDGVNFFLEPGAFTDNTNYYISAISGIGKSFLAFILMIHDICFGKSGTLICPTGAIYKRIIDYLAFLMHSTENINFKVPSHILNKIMDKYVIIDFADPNQPYRYNPLLTEPGDSIQETVGDFMRVIEAIIGNTDEMRRLSNILTCMLECLAASPYLTKLSDTILFLTNTSFRNKILSSINLEKHKEMTFAVNYYRGFFDSFRGNDQIIRIESTINVAQASLCGEAMQ